MKKHDIQKEILLAMSGELSPSRRKALEARLRDSAEDDAYRRDVEQLMADARRHLPDSEPAPSTVAHILDLEGTTRRGVLIPFPHPVLRTLAGAAALAMVVAGWFWLTPLEPVSDPVGELHAIVAMVSDTDALLQHDPAELAETERMRVLARELLIMEGFIEEQQGDQELQSEEPESTSLLWRSTSGYPQGIYG